MPQKACLIDKIRVSEGFSKIHYARIAFFAEQAWYKFTTMDAKKNLLFVFVLKTENSIEIKFLYIFYKGSLFQKQPLIEKNLPFKKFFAQKRLNKVSLQRI
jgi:hypothetical protein